MTDDMGDEPEAENTFYEDMKVEGEDLLGKIKELIREGNARRAIIKNERGEILLQIPLTVGVVGAAIAPVLAAVGAVAALVTSCTITVERVQTSEDKDNGTQ